MCQTLQVAPNLVGEIDKKVNNPKPGVINAVKDIRCYGGTEEGPSWLRGGAF